MQNDNPAKFLSRVNELANNASETVKASFAQSLSTISKLDVDSFEKLANALQNSRLDEDSCMNLAWLAGQLRNKNLTKALLGLFEESPGLAWQAAQSLTLLKSKRAIKPLIEILRHKESSEKRQAAAYALQALPEAAATQALMQTLADKNEQAQVRGQAAESLASVEYVQPEFISSLLSGLQDEEVEVRFWCLYSLGQLGAPEVIPNLEKLTGDENVLPRWWAVGKEAQDAIENIRSRYRAE